MLSNGKEVSEFVPVEFRHELFVVGLKENKKDFDKFDETLDRKEDSDKVESALRKVVNTSEGTAKFANVPNFEIGGKTGTADKVLNGEYSEGKVNTFASILPTSIPQYVFVVMLDGPKKSKDYYYCLLYTSPSPRDS